MSENKVDIAAKLAGQPKLIPYGGYYSTVIPKHEPLLTETGPETPLGEYMRHFWHPVCMSEELTDTPRFIEIMSEELVAFRDHSGNVGVLHAHCCHRGASLEYGLVKEKGIMCCYHGWTWDVDGRCLEVPSAKGEEAEGEQLAARVWQPAYKAFERNGLVFAYMGPPEKEPPFPEWEDDFTLMDGDELVPYSNRDDANWLQVQDNSADQYHHIPLHTTAVVPGHEQSTTFGEAGAAPYLVRPDLQFFPVDDGRGMAWTASRRIDEGKIFIRVNQQVLPNISCHSYLFEDGSKRKLFSRLHMIRWTVPVNDTACKMIGWRMVGAGIDPRGLDVALRHLIGFETMDFLDGQVSRRRPELQRYWDNRTEKTPFMQPQPDHRARECYKEAQWAPGDYEATVSQRPIAVHALENPMKADGGVFLFRKLLRDAITGDNPQASPAAWKTWLEENPGPNLYCQGNILMIKEGATLAEEVERRRDAARKVISTTAESNSLKGAERVQFVKDKYAELEKSYS